MTNSVLHIKFPNSIFKVKYMNKAPFSDDTVTYCAAVRLAHSENDRLPSGQTHDGFKQHESPPASFICCTLWCLSRQTATSRAKGPQLSSRRGGTPLIITQGALVVFIQVLFLRH